jgi:hypothetical protein
MTLLELDSLRSGRGWRHSLTDSLNSLPWCDLSPQYLSIPVQRESTPNPFGLLHDSYHASAGWESSRFSRTSPSFAGMIIHLYELPSGSAWVIGEKLCSARGRNTVYAVAEAKSTSVDRPRSGRWRLQLIRSWPKAPVDVPRFMASMSQKLYLSDTCTVRSPEASSVSCPRFGEVMTSGVGEPNIG